MKNIQQIYKRALWSCIILFLVKAAPIYTAAAYRELASNSQELVKKMIDEQQLTLLEVDQRALLKEKILGHIGNHDADFSPSSQSVAQILSRMSLEAAFESIKAKGAITPAITEYLRAYSSVIHRSEKFDRQEVRGLDDYDMWGNSSASIPEEAPIYSSSVNMHNKDAWRCISFLGEEEKLVIGFEARLLKESVLLSALTQDRETNVLTINKMLTPMSLKELYFALEASADNNLEAYLTSKNESELIKIANTANYLEIQKLYEAVTDHVAQIIAKDSTPATSFAQMLFDSETSLKGSMKKNVQEELQDTLPKNIIDDIVRKIGFKLSTKYIDTTTEDQEQPYGSLFKGSNNSADGKFSFSLHCNTFEPAAIVSNRNKALVHKLDWIQRGNNKDYPNAWSKDSKKFSLGSRNGTIGIFQVDTWECIHKLVGHTQNISTTIWSNDGLLLASAAAGDGTVRIWNTITGKLLQTLDTHAIQIDFSPDSRYLASASSDGKINTWDVSTGKLIQTLVLGNSWIIDYIKDNIRHTSAWRRETLGNHISWLPDGLKVRIDQNLRYTYKVYEDRGANPTSTEKDSSETLRTYYIYEHETFEQKQERVYRFIQRVALADAQQEKRKSSCVIN